MKKFFKGSCNRVLGLPIPSPKLVTALFIRKEAKRVNPGSKPPHKKIVAGKFIWDGKFNDVWTLPEVYELSDTDLIILYSEMGMVLKKNKRLKNWVVFEMLTREIHPEQPLLSIPIADTDAVKRFFRGLLRYKKTRKKYLYNNKKDKNGRWLRKIEVES